MLVSTTAELFASVEGAYSFNYDDRVAAANATCIVLRAGTYALSRGLTIGDRSEPLALVAEDAGQVTLDGGGFTSHMAILSANVQRLVAACK